MRMSERIIDGVAVLAVSGKMMGGPDQRKCHEHIRRLVEEGVPWIVMDLGQVVWMNSSGIGLLVGCLTSCRNAGGNLVVARAQKKVRSIFMMTQIIKIFDVFNTVKEGVAFLAKQREEARRT
jgi:anti-sigma B factor antagonist